ncbi:MAG: hypothetical protein KAV82_15270, partial [Phycisphaerae bacterium]|nr:hypothetical protein [Phycisphaerae bacterium]
EVFKPLLPVRVGALTRLKEADEFRTGWLDLPLGDVEYSEPIPLAQCTLRQGPGIRKVFPVPGSENRSPGIDTLIARRRVGRGSLVFVAASLRDLTSPRCPPDECDPSVFFRRLLEIRTTTRQDYPERMVYKDLESKIGFRAVGALYLVSAMLFVMAYIALATFGSWGFLKSRGWSRHNWTVFAVFAGFAGVVGISTAQYARGVGQKLNQLTIVDATAGTSEACAVAYFGLKTGTHSVLDLWLAEDYAQQPEPQPTSCFLRSLPSGRAMGEGRLTFTDPGTYELRPAKAELLRVPIRATLKQFEGRWQGHLTGGIDASVRIVPRSFDKSRKDLQEVSEPCFDAASRITNNLGVDLENCFIFQPTANRYMHGTVDVSPRASGIRSEIIVHHVGQLKDGETYKLVSLYQDANGKWLTWNRWYHSLLDWQNQWGKFARPLGPGFTPKGRTANVSQAHYEEVLLLLTALSEYDEMNSAIRRPYDQQPLIFSRERCRPLDLSDILTRDMILLVGFARNPGPVSFCTRSNPKRAYKKLVPEEAWTVYRIVIPVN